MSTPTSSPLANPRPPVSPSQSPSAPSMKPSGNFAPKSRETAQSGAKITGLVEAQCPSPIAGPASQPAAAPAVNSKCVAAPMESQPPPETGILQHPDSPGAETGEERALIAEGVALLVREA